MLNCNKYIINLKSYQAKYLNYTNFFIKPKPKGQEDVQDIPPA